MPLSAFGEARLFLRADQRKHSAPGHWNIGMSGQFQHAQRVQRLLVAPCVAGHDGDAQHLYMRSLKQRQHRHLVGAAGAGAVLIDQHQPLLRRTYEWRRECPERQC